MSRDRDLVPLKHPLKLDVVDVNHKTKHPGHAWI